MSLDIGRDFWCAYQGKWVCESEFNGDPLKPFYHEPQNGEAYIAYGTGACKCLTCGATSKILCKNCDYPDWLIYGGGDRCVKCMAQYKKNGKLR